MVSIILETSLKSKPLISSCRNPESKKVIGVDGKGAGARIPAPHPLLIQSSSAFFPVSHFAKKSCRTFKSTLLYSLKE